ncbi:MAG: alkaline phosphatase family protein [Chitinophagaceae bacterium]|nr:alkaline phosphatase family protein [Chitinophagaceae bacterium]
MRNMLLLFLVFITTASVYSQDTIQHIEKNRKNATSQLNKPYVILISADGFRYDYAEKFSAQNLLRLSAGGVRAESMIPAFPSKTFPNHYSIATGLYPAHHGIVHNEFYDRKRKDTYKISKRSAVEDASWYGGTPIWVLAEKQEMVTASYHFVGTEAPIQHTYPTYWYKFDDQTGINYRIDKVIDWLQLPEAVRPHFISFYMSEVDHAGHRFGPDAPETDSAVQFVDRAIGRLTSKVQVLGLPVNFIFLADHGMTAVDTVSGINITRLIDTNRFIVRGGSTSLNLYARQAKFIIPTYQLLKSQENGFKVYLKEDIPAKWHYSKPDDKYNRIGDILITVNHPKVFSKNNSRIWPGEHGFDPAIKDMHAVFYSWGPQIKEGISIAPFENIQVYPLICQLLGLQITEKIDGDPKTLKEIVK